MNRRRPTRWALGVAAACANLLLLAAPLALLDASTWWRPAVPLFLLLASLFAFADASGQRADDAARRAALPLATGLGVLAVFVSALACATSAPLAAQLVGGAAMIGGIALRRSAMTTLAERFVTEVQPLSGNDATLITKGPYGWVRHPSETGTLLVTVGAVMLLGAMPAALLWLLLVALVIARIRREDDELRAVHGSAHERYAASVPALVPRRLTRSRLVM